MSDIHLGDDTVLTIQAMNGQYRIEADPEQDDAWPDPVDALTSGEDGWIAVLTGTQHGPVAIRFEFLPAAPDAVATDWDMVGERDLHCEDSVVRIKDLFSDAQPHVITVTPGIYRLRLHVSGRSAAASVRIVTEPIERHFIQMWPVAESSDPVLLVGPDDWAKAYE
jgi:hypothetical protein